MGTRGPVPKRDDQRRRRNRPEMPTMTAPSGAQVQPDPADDQWHPIAINFYEALAQSGQSSLFEASDWAVARYVAEAMSRSLAASGKVSGQLFAAVMSASSNLLATEGDRRRLKVELERGSAEPAEDAKVTALDAYRRAAGG